MLKALVILCEKWPPFSPDLNPIKTLWKYIKIYLEKKYRDYVFKLYDI
jgi:transposase